MKPINRVLELIGTTVSSVAIYKDYIEIILDTYKGIAVCNDWTIEPEGTRLELLIGKSILYIDDSEYYISINFSDDHCLLIDLKDAAWNGPEAVIIGLGEADPIVWR